MAFRKMDGPLAQRMISVGLWQKRQPRKVEKRKRPERSTPLLPKRDECNFLLCSKPVAGAGGHAFLRVNCNDEDTHFGAFPRKASKECERRGCFWLPPGAIFGQLTAETRPFIDSGDKPVIGEPACKELTIEKSCDDLCKCLKNVVDQINNACIPYSPTPAGFGVGDCNSNCAARWMLEACGLAEIPFSPPIAAGVGTAGPGISIGFVGWAPADQFPRPEEVTGNEVDADN
jgi:hypothetical protein